MSQCEIEANAEYQNKISQAHSTIMYGQSSHSYHAYSSAIGIFKRQIKLNHMYTCCFIDSTRRLWVFFI